MTDATGYGGRDDQGQASLQSELIDALDVAAKKAGLDRHTWARQAQGDGELAVLPDGDVEPQLVDDFVRQLASVLDERNDGRLPTARLRLRVAIHHGVAIPAANGFSGKGPVVVGRLLSSSQLRAALALTGADLALIVSDQVFTDTIAQKHTTLRWHDFREVDVRVKEYQAHAWIHVPRHDLSAVDLLGGMPESGMASAAAAAEAPEPDPTTPAPTPAATANPSAADPAGDVPEPRERTGPPTTEISVRDINAPQSRFTFGVNYER